MGQFFVEITDTFGGEANFSWVTRHLVTAKTQRGAVQKISRNSGLSWRKNYTDGETARYDSKSGATCFFISEASGEETRHYSKINII